MNIARFILSLLAIGLLPGCSTLVPEPIEGAVNEPALNRATGHATQKHCTYEIRDLSVAWGTQSYWCCPGHPDPVESDQSPRHNKPQTESQLTPRQTILLDSALVAESAEVEAAYSLSSTQQIPATVDRAYIPFAQGSTQLGPKGRSLAVALANGMVGASRILLRSYAIPGDPEHFAVTRAVAVRDALNVAGLNVPVTIAHPRTGSGRSIEVIAQ